MKITYHPLYKIDENDNIRIWWMVQDGNSYQTHSGIQGGKIVVSKPKVAKPKNVGKANEIDEVEQAGLEVQRKYAEQLKTGGYYATIEEAREGFKTYFQPMLAEKWSERKAKVTFPVWSQPKFDGIRATANSCELKSREGEPFHTPTRIMRATRRFNEMYPSIVLDGELYNHKLRNDFEKISSLLRKQKPTEAHIEEANELVEYHVYDMFDRDHPNMTFSQRQARLKDLLHEFDDKLIFVEATLVETEEELDELYGTYLEDQYEGQMVRTDEPYEMKRSKSLLKRKEFEDAEFEIDRVEEGVGNWSGAVKIVHIKLEDGSTQKSGVAGPYDLLAQYLEEADTFPGTDATIRFQGRTRDGKLRFPVVKFFWRGKRDV